MKKIAYKTDGSYIEDGPSNWMPVIPDTIGEHLFRSLCLGKSVI